jgi:WG containing repeat
MRMLALAVFCWTALGTLTGMRAECVPASLLWIPRDPGADALYRFEQEGKAGYIDQSGRVVIEPRSDLAAGAEFRHGLAPLKGQSGRFLDIQGNVVGSAPVVRSTEAPLSVHFSEQGACRPLGECGLKLGCDFALVDRSGHALTSEVYQNALAFHEGLAAVEKQGRWGYVDEAGQVIVPLRFADARSFAGGLARVRLTEDGSWGYIDRLGKMAIAPWFEFADDFAEGLALVGNSDDGFWYIRPDGGEAFGDRFLLATRFFKGVAHVQLLDPDSDDDDTFAYIDQSGRKVFTYRRR